MYIQYQDQALIIFESALFRTTSTLVIGKDYLLLVDPNWLPREIDFIEQWTEQVGANKKRYLLFTHSDYDHIIGYGRFKDYETIASRNFAENDQQATVLQQINHFDDEYYIKRDYEIVYPRIDHPIDGDGTELELSGERFHFYQAPGHNPDGLITYQADRQLLIVGDYLSNIEFPYVYDSIQRYHGTLEKLEDIINTQGVKHLISGHGDYTSDSAEMRKRLKDSYAYLEQLLCSVKKGTEFDFERLMKPYGFPGIMRKFHEGNVALAKKELK